MNPNDLLAQQQAYLNQVMQQNQHWQWGILAIWATGVLVSFGVLYLFYARLRDIADELRKMRILFELAEDRKARAANLPNRPPSGAASENPFSSDDRFKPRVNS